MGSKKRPEFIPETITDEDWTKFVEIWNKVYVNLSKVYYFSSGSGNSAETNSDMIHSEGMLVPEHVQYEYDDTYYIGWREIPLAWIKDPLSRIEQYHKETEERQRIEAQERESWERAKYEEYKKRFEK